MEKVTIDSSVHMEVAPTGVVSTHNITCNKHREEVIASIGGDGTPIAVFYWDRGHKDGAEKHTLTSNAIIIIHNAISGKLVTKLLARTGQILRYRGMTNELNEKTRRMKNWVCPKHVLNLARLHEKNGLNYA